MASAAGEGVSLVHQAVAAIRNHIRDHDLKVGDNLPGESHFAANLGVSRAVMREAFGALAALRVLDVANGRRARVGAIDGSVMATSLDHAVSTAQISFNEVWDVRRTVELRIAALAAERRTDAEAKRIVELADAMTAAAENLPELTRIDVAFHQAIADASHNQLFRQMVRSYAPLMEVAVPQAWGTRQTRDQQVATLAGHRALAKAIYDCDPAGAVASMEAHFDASIQDLMEGTRTG
ncbi:FadR/GntR family transcriptional regulator [Sphingomonas sp. G-3-2-10]|uniref:FadR/GntR family transcriptional regulator n=1 Tax=Sphingomonas sp. G-3-2-10 TaxID=2728838 RepID=UPI00146C067F|nr:FadR/GntR family transcriptional regulator [Sphingomonas sp. G-3-2-10]NML05489.1 FadR family transcriptional regulator [Sphingomonas sp. G-3-2-10]